MAYRYEFNAKTLEKQTGYFYGYKRPYGGVGIRNEIYIIPTVGCVNNVCMRLANEAQSLVSGTMSDDIEDTSDELASGQLQIEI